MMTYLSFIKSRILIAASATCLTVMAADTPAQKSGGTFYKRPNLFSTRPSDSTKLVQSIDRFGPVGIGIELHPPAFVMKVKNVEEGSPAAAAGKLKAGQIIESINGQTLKDIDPRIQLGNIITQTEATDGKVTFIIREKEGAAPETVAVTIPVLGAYSETWPLDCPKSDKIVRNLAKRFTEDGFNGSIGLEGPKLLFMLSTGDDGDLEVAKEWVAKTIEKNKNFADNRLPYAWFIGWGAPPLAEYYLRTGDESVLPLLKDIADAAKKVQYHDAWGGRGLAKHHMGIAGTSTLTFILLARQCGIEVNESMLQSSLKHFSRFAGRGVNPYPDIRPENTFTDNGRVGKLAYAMQAAAYLAANPETSIYAQARDISALKSFYSSTYMLHGHTGGGIGEVWRSAAMGLLYELAPEHYREFMDNRQWFYELSRRYNGSFGIVGGASYDKEDWGITMGLTYTAPRKKLCIFGAPRSKFSKTYSIPERPWGTAGDDAFYSIKGPVDNTGKSRDLSKETLADDAGVAVDRKMSNPEVADEEILKYIYHPEHRFREVAATAIFNHKRFHLIPQLLKDADPRVRNAGVMAIKPPRVRRGALIPGFPRKELSDEIQQQLFKMLNDPDESWFTIDKLLQSLKILEPQKLVPHIDRILHFVKQDEWWLRESAGTLLAPLAADNAHYKTILPVLEMAFANSVRGSSIRGLKDLAENAKTASPEVQKAVRSLLSKLYLNFQRGNSYAGGIHSDVTEKNYLNIIADAMATLPLGLDTLYEISQERNPLVSLEHRDLYLKQTDPNAFGPKIKASLNEIILEELIPIYVGQNWKELQKEASWEPPRRKEQFAVGKLGGGSFKDGLSNLYDYAGITDYNWKTFGPQPDAITWRYTMFDPKEKQSWESPKARYRNVTLPKGMENWHAPEFDADKAGWKTGRAPFAIKNGELKPLSDSCSLPYCGCSKTPNTLWDNEVLLMRSDIELPPLKKNGYRYRLNIGGRSHVGSGDGLKIYIDGQLVHEQKSGTGKRVGAQACGFFIDSEMAKLFDKGGTHQIAVLAFLNRHKRSKAKQGHLSISFDEMKIPPLTEEILHKSATLIPMTCSDWQAIQNPDVTMDENEGKFVYDGEFIPNPKIMGTWKAVAWAESIDEFITPQADDKKSKKRKPNPAISKITFLANGKTDKAERIWSGDMLMNLSRFEALKMELREVDGTEYLFIEEGGFHPKYGNTWKSPLSVLKKVK